MYWVLFQYFCLLYCAVSIRLRQRVINIPVHHTLPFSLQFALTLLLLQVPFVLVGNKADLDSNRKVTQDEAQRRAESWHCDYMETSAKTKCVT